MEPNKFEKIMKEQLQEREIRPSSDAWQKVAEQLEVEGPSKPKGFLWWGIAASVIGVLLLSILLMNIGNSPMAPETQIVTTPEKKEVERVQNASNPVTNDLDQLDKVLQQKKEDGVASEQTKIEKMVVPAAVVPKAVEKEHRTLEDTVVETAVANNDVQPLNDGAETAINMKIAEVLAKVDDLENGDIELTDAEVDSLLLQAQKELFNDQLFRKDHSVDAMVLLADVEEELDQSFRDQIFDKLKTGFLKVRTAVAQRNN